MEFTYDDGNISLEKTLNRLDIMALNFSEKLSEAGIQHVVLSGYKPFLFGGRTAFDRVEFVCKDFFFEAFSRFWKSITPLMGCLTAETAMTAYEDYLQEVKGVRFAYKDDFTPHVEMRMASNDVHLHALAEAKTVTVNGGYHFRAPPLELQIAYHLYLGQGPNGGGKETEDARFLFGLFGEHLDRALLGDYLDSLKVGESWARNILGWTE